MPVVIELLLILAFTIVPPFYCAYVARQKGRSAVLWFIIGLVLSIFGVIGIHLTRPFTMGCPECGAGFEPGTPKCPGCGFDLPDRYALATMVFTMGCPECGAGFEPGTPKCPGCGFDLPDRYALATMVEPDKQYDGHCSTCRTPYAYSDYRADAIELRCSRCKALLPQSAGRGAV
jgi:hypothetical protein